MLIVPADTVERLENKKTVTSNPIQTMKTDMSDLLENKKLNDDEKWKQYSQLLMKFLMHVKDFSKPIEIPIKEIPSVDLTQKTDNQVDIIKPKRLDFSSLIEKTVPKLVKPKAMALYNFLENKETFSWDDKGQILIENVLVPQSNIIDLFNDVLRNRKHSTHPVGGVEFYNFLKASNVPNEYIANHKRRAYISNKSVNEGETLSKKLKSPSTKSRTRWEKFEL